MANAPRWLGGRWAKAERRFSFIRLVGQFDHIGPAGLRDYDGKMIGPVFQRRTFLSCISIAVVSADQLRRQVISRPTCRNTLL
jgi:hypothetical protein